MADYGYGDAAPDSAKYGYGDAAPDHDPYGYGDARPDTDVYGYGDARPDDAAMYGYGDDETYQTGYNDDPSSSGGAMQPDHHRSRRSHGRNKSDDASVHSAATAESYGDYGDDPDPQQPRRQRYRRRGSVTKYSLDAQETVQKEYEQNDHIINQFRELQAIPQSPMPMDTSYPDSPMQADVDEGHHHHHHHKDHKKQKEKKRGLRRFTIGF